MGQQSTPASYYRGGTSRGVIFHKRDLPDDPSQWPHIFRQVIGSPDVYGRQLDGMGAGISSLSKVSVVGPPTHPQADVDYTFYGIGIETDEVDSAGNCGNMSSAIGPFALNQNLIRPSPDSQVGKPVEIMIHNTNTGVLIRSQFEMAPNGLAKTTGDFAFDGVSGTGSCIQLDFLNPGGSKTGQTLPTGNAVDKLGEIDISCVDVANPVVFVRAVDIGLDGAILPNQLNAQPEMLARLDQIRCAGAEAMGIIGRSERPPRTIPKVAIVSPAKDHRLLSGETMKGETLDLVVRFISDEQPHRAIPLTGALCTASAAKIPGTIVHQTLRNVPVVPDMITIGHSSGKIQVDARQGSNGAIECATVFRTAKRLMEGRIFWDEPPGAVMA